MIVEKPLQSLPVRHPIDPSDLGLQTGGVAHLGDRSGQQLRVGGEIESVTALDRCQVDPLSDSVGIGPDDLEVSRLIGLHRQIARDDLRPPFQHRRLVA